MRTLRTLAPITLLHAAAACSRLTTEKVESYAEAAAGSFYALEATSLAGEPVPLERYAGQVTLVVNTASECGYTPQYAGLQELQESYGDRGFAILGFPSGDFMDQEFDTAEEIRAFCDSRFGVTFPMFEKVHVKEGDGQSPIFRFLGGATGELPGGNFGKDLVGRDGRVIRFFATPVEPTSDDVRAAIEAALAAA
ncbi:MAG: glutathione peroxidase [Planctomycetota bacterium JB042]